MAEEVSAMIIAIGLLLLGAAIVGATYLAADAGLHFWHDLEPRLSQDIVVRVVIDGNSTCNFAIDGLNVTKLGQ